MTPKRQTTQFLRKIDALLLQQSNERNALRVERLLKSAAPACGSQRMRWSDTEHDFDPSGFHPWCQDVDCEHQEYMEKWNFPAWNVRREGLTMWLSRVEITYSHFNVYDPDRQKEISEWSMEDAAQFVLE